MTYQNRPIRRSALLGPWGIGAMVPFPNDESLMIAGLDMWHYKDSEDFIIKDERLQKRLGVKELRMPPDYRDKSSDNRNYNLRIPAIRFPKWHYCPNCGYMKKASYYETHPTCNRPQWRTGRSCNLKARYSRKLIPERFVVICPDGHIEDFPIAEWIHKDREYDEESCQIRRSTGGSSASLSGVRYTCSCGASGSMAFATTPGALKRINYNCKGSRPWLGIEKDLSACNRSGEDLRVVLRGATNVWFSHTISSIHIPTLDDGTQRKIVRIVDEYYDSLQTHRINGKLNREFINMLADSKKVNPDDLFDAFVHRCNSLNEGVDINEDMTEDEYRYAEYKALIQNSGSDALEFHSINHGIEEYDYAIHPYFKSISIVPKLRETRAFVGFSRLEPKENATVSMKKELSIAWPTWLPAIEVFGEGIFIEFNSKSLKEWSLKPNVQERINRLNATYRKSVFGRRSQGNLRPEYVLIHTFAHLLINQLSFECGYGSSALRERIYSESTTNNLDMHGLLIYTASGDSEGSLGGLVRQGMKGLIENTIVNALNAASWCTSDPICIESGGQGPESCNLAACHNCSLLPETSCEKGNRLLDRGLLIGTLTDPSIAYFKGLKVNNL